MGLIALPAMMRHRYEPGFATGSICAAGTLGQIIPPATAMGGGGGGAAAASLRPAAPLGQILPPATVMVVLGEVLASAYQQAQLSQGLFSIDTISVGDLYTGALIPSL